MKAKLFSAVVLSTGLLFGASAAQAYVIDTTCDASGQCTTTGFIENIYVFDQLEFLADGGTATFQTTSYAGLTSFDPFLALWTSSGVLLASNNDRSAFDYDAYITQNLTAGETYILTISNWPYTPVGATLAEGFAISNPAYDPGSGLWHPALRNGDWTLVTTGVTAVPEPETWAMLLAGLGIVGAVARRRRK
jgi:hypothetical protein